MAPSLFPLATNDRVCFVPYTLSLLLPFPWLSSVPTPCESFPCATHATHHSIARAVKKQKQKTDEKKKKKTGHTWPTSMYNNRESQGVWHARHTQHAKRLEGGSVSMAQNERGKRVSKSNPNRARITRTTDKQSPRARKTLPGNNTRKGKARTQAYRSRKHYRARPRRRRRKVREDTVRRVSV